MKLIVLFLLLLATSAFAINTDHFGKRKNNAGVKRLVKSIYIGRNNGDVKTIDNGTYSNNHVGIKYSNSNNTVIDEDTKTDVKIDKSIHDNDLDYNDTKTDVKIDKSIHDNDRDYNDTKTDVNIDKSIHHNSIDLDYSTSIDKSIHHNSIDIDYTTSYDYDEDIDIDVNISKDYDDTDGGILRERRSNDRNSHHDDHKHGNSHHDDHKHENSCHDDDHKHGNSHHDDHKHENSCHDDDHKHENSHHDDHKHENSCHDDDHKHENSHHDDHKCDPRCGTGVFHNNSKCLSNGRCHCFYPGWTGPDAKFIGEGPHKGTIVARFCTFGCDWNRHLLNPKCAKLPFGCSQKGNPLTGTCLRNGKFRCIHNWTGPHARWVHGRDGRPGFIEADNCNHGCNLATNSPSCFPKFF